ncbi:unnamed protein product [Candida verbasci]|uniref:Vacuolar protein sorting-associated protein 62 n=1 Tax=Candida verbasci TaxID=1227364 RepID=A0A9W4XB70_9ASCO|nr:unnamed protein product [Candida verbasci]
MISLLLIFTFINLAFGIISFDVSNSSNCLFNIINNEERELKIENILKDPLIYKDYPSIKHLPSAEERSIKDGEIPDYVINYSPLVYLYSEEKYLPYGIKEYVTNFYATFNNGSNITGFESISIQNLTNIPKNEETFLTSNTDFDSDPEWITGVKNKPNLINGEIENAPATLIIVDKGNGWVDAFWFYFYSFNLGPFVMGQGPYGNHVGDWEHSLVRYYKGEPVIVWMSAHGGGGAFYYHNLEKYKLDSRHPIIFSARGTHANYPSVGQHPHDLPYGILSDFTDRGPLWNPNQNYLGYTYDGNFVYPIENTNVKHIGREIEYDNWLSFKGHWGDKQLPYNDPRQTYSIVGGYKYINGPTGPLCKNLMRLKPCERAKWWNFWQGCNVRENIKWGVGIESEGYNCGNLFINVKTNWLKKLLQRLTWGGGLCFLIDLIYG